MAAGALRTRDHRADDLGVSGKATGLVREVKEPGLPRAVYARRAPAQTLQPIDRPSCGADRPVSAASAVIVICSDRLTAPSADLRCPCNAGIALRPNIHKLKACSALRCLP